MKMKKSLFLSFQTKIHTFCVSSPILALGVNEKEIIIIIRIIIKINETSKQISTKKKLN